MGRKRSRIEIIADILEAVDNAPQNPTRLATIANLPYDRLQPILRDLEARGVVTVTPAPDGKGSIVELTEKGRVLLWEIRRLRKVLEDFGLDIL
ncbi:MAG: hypothetical protein F7B17_05090 [Desulfurococcales archaeon]|nr:hypothetical protein [Desulfurococcales archaeon]